MMMIKLSVYAYDIYYVNRMIFTLSVGDSTPIVAVAIAEMANEANILIGKNNFQPTEYNYANTLMIYPNNYVIYIMLNIENGMDYHYGVVVGE